MIIILFIYWFYYILLILYFKVLKIYSYNSFVKIILIKQFETTEKLDQIFINYINDNNNYDKLTNFKTYIVHKIDNEPIYVDKTLIKFLNLYEQTYKSCIMREILMEIFINDFRKKPDYDLGSKIRELFEYSNNINFLKYKYFIKIDNQFYKTEEFEVSFLHYLLFTISYCNINFIFTVIDNYPELLNNTNNKYKLHPIHITLLTNNFNIFKFFWKHISKNHKKLNLYEKNKIKYDKLEDNIIDYYGYNMLEFSILNKCESKIINCLMNNFNYDFYQLNKQKENIITLLIRVNIKEYFDIFYNLGYTYNDILNGIVYFAQGKINN